MPLAFTYWVDWRIGLILVACGFSIYPAPCVADNKSAEEKLAADLANPLSPVTSFSAQYRMEFGVGPENETNYQLRLQPSFFKPVSNRSAFLLRTIAPVVFRNWPTNEWGLGDITLVPYYVPDITKQTFIGYGAAIGIPSATDDSLGSEKWTAGPAMIIANTGDPLTFGSLLQHIWSYAGNRERDDISVTTVQPFMAYLIGDGWTASLNVEASYNWNLDEDKLTLPIGVGASKVVSLGDTFMNFGLAAVTYTQKPEFAPDWELRINATYVFK